MKAVVIEEFGGAEVLQYKEVQNPEPAEDEVLIKVYKTSVNFADLKIRKGIKTRGKLPLILGHDLVGVIEKVGRQTKGLKVGQRVIAFPSTGTYAEYAVANHQLAYPIPDDLDLTVAAASPIVSFLSYKLLKDIASITPGDNVLVHSGSGGVGTTAIQLAKYLGASKVYATTGDLSKAQIVKDCGADEVFSYDDFVEGTNKLTENNGVDIILDSVSGKVTERSFGCLALFGKLVHFGNSSGTIGELKTNDLHASCRSILGFSLGTTRKMKPHLVKEISKDVIQLIQQKAIDIKVGHEFNLEDVATAHNLMEMREHQGKIVLNVSEE